jgi:hypothetical protein
VPGVPEAVSDAAHVRFEADPDALARLIETVVDGGVLAWLADRDTATTFAASSSTTSSASPAPPHKPWCRKFLRHSTEISQGRDQAMSAGVGCW